MPRKKLEGLYFQKSTGHWVINKRIGGRRIHKSTGLRTRAGAERMLQELLDRQSSVLASGNAPTFRDAAIRFLRTTNRKRVDQDAIKLSKLFPYLADLPLDVIDVDRLTSFVDTLKADGKKGNTINGYLGLVRLILRKSEREWKTETGGFWLDRAPYIPLQRVTDARQPYPISWAEQRLLMPYLPTHLQTIVLAILNMGLRDSEACGLRWEWFHQLEGTDTRFFVIPGAEHKNRHPRVVVLNSVAEGIVNSLSSRRDSEYVFSYRGRRLRTIRNDGWLNAVSRVVEAYPSSFQKEAPEGLRRLRVHDLRHTVGRRLRAAGVGEMDIATLLGHKHGSITHYYADAELLNLKKQLEKIRRPTWDESPKLTVVTS
ncbi:MAG: site-specific integrase [Candidatus Sedimenticola sp. PURPLELP]